MKITKVRAERMHSIRTILLKDDFKQAAANLERQFPDPRHIKRTIHESCLLMTLAGDTPVLFLKACIDLKLCADAYRIAVTMDDSVEKRSAVLGSEPMPRIKNNGRRGAYNVTPDTVMDVLEPYNVRQGILGAVGGKPRRPAQLSKLTRDRPKLLNHLRDLCEEIDDIHAKYLPTPYALQRAEVKKSPEFRLWRTALSSLYIPKNLRCGYHRDSCNLLGTMTALLALGNFSGGELVFPRWRIAIALEPGDLLFFNPQELHGNLVIDGQRASIAAYCARNLHR
jgi:hypothetical protein